MTCETTHAEPYQQVEPKRSYDEVPVSFDWHDYLASKWVKGAAISGGIRIRLPRGKSRGLQFRALNDGVSGSREPQWPRVAGQTVTDGDVSWQAEPVDSGSLRTSVVTSTYPAVDGLTYGLESSQDLIYTIMVAGGSSGQTYNVPHRVVLANGEKKEGVAVLPVAD